MSAGSVRLDGNRFVALTRIGCLEAQCALAADGEEGDVCSRVAWRCAGRTRNLRGSTAPGIQDVKKFPSIGNQRFDGIEAARAKRRVGNNDQIAEIVIDPEAGNLIVL